MPKNQQKKSSESSKSWYFFYGDGKEHHVKIADLPPPPPWRKFKQIEQSKPEISKKSAELEDIEKRWLAIQQLAYSPENERGIEKGKNFRISTPTNQEEDDSEEPLVNVVDAVNAAIYLRRPLLVTGNPGSGKTSLAYAIAYELKLGPVLTWAITARSNLEDALYRYDAIARLQDSQLRLQESKLNKVQVNKVEDIGQYITLGSVGTAFLPSLHPRVLLIDEIDKSDINLPNDLLHLFEEGRFEIPELVRWADQSQTDNNPKSESEQAQAKSEENEPKSVEVRTEDSGIKAPIVGGRVCCSSFPIVIMTSNGERDFPPAFLRRCLRIQMPDPDEQALRTIVKVYFNDNSKDEEQSNDWKQLIEFFSSKDNRERATDQLLNAIYMCNNLVLKDLPENLKEILFDSLSN